jgi:hypothetical protein
VNARIALARCLIARDGYGSAQAHGIALQAHRTASAIDALDADTAFGALALAYPGSSSQGHLQGVEYAQKMLDSATTPGQHYTACWAMGNTLFWLADFATARGWLERNIELGHGLTLPERMSYFPSDLAVFAQAEMGWLLWFVGEPERSKQALAESAQLARNSTTRQDLCIASCFAGFVAWCDGDRTALPTHAEAAAATSLREGFGFWSCVAELLRALAYADSTRPIDLPELIRNSEGLLEGYAAARGTAHWLVAGALVASGQHEVAVALVEETLAASTETEHRQCSMDLWRLKAVALGGLGRAAEAALALETAVEHARALGAHGWLARWAPLAVA